MDRIILRIFVLLLIVITLSFASNVPPPGDKGSEFSATQGSVDAPPNQGNCPKPTEELIVCARQWACQNLLHLDLRCLLNLNGNPLGGLLGGGGGLRPGGGGLLGGTGSGGSGGILGGLLG